MSKFKVGDKVKRTYRDAGNIKQGGIYEVVDENKWDGLYLKGHEQEGTFDADYFELVEEKSAVEEAPKFKAMLFQSNSEQEATDIQMALFEAGYKWASGEECVRYTHAKYFSTTSVGSIFYMSNANELALLDNRDKYTTCKVVVERKLSIVEEVEKVAYAGKLYNKKDFEAAIATLSVLD